MSHFDLAHHVKTHGWMSLSRYEALVRQLYQLNLTCQAKLGLENIQRLHAALGEPLKGIPNIIHVGGTNGKGSVAFKVARTMQYSGLRTGLFVSPHISSFRERTQVDGRLISEEEVVDLLTSILRLRESHCIPATFFEVTTAMAFRFFADQRLDAAVVEVGLGGRLDATNILTPRLSVLTSIGMDHLHILGPTRGHVAREKAGIMKRGAPVLVGPQCPLPLMKELAEQAGSPLLLAPPGPFENYEAENVAIASAAVDELTRPPSGFSITKEGRAKGLASRPPARFEKLTRRVTIIGEGGGGRRKERQVDVVLDVGHNGPAVTRLFEWLQRDYHCHVSPPASNLNPQAFNFTTQASNFNNPQAPSAPPSKSKRLRFRVVLGLSADKDVGECLATIFKFVDPSHLHFIQAAHPRAMRGADLAKAAAKLGAHIPEANFNYNSVGQGVEAALQLAAQSEGEKGEVVVVCGTFFIMAEARQALGIREPVDSAAVAQVAGAHFKSMQEVFAPTT